MYIAKNLLSFFIRKLMEFSFKNWNLCDLEWWYRSDEVSRYISGIRASWTLLNAWCLLFVFGTYSPCCVSRSYKDLIGVVITCLFLWCLLYHEFQCLVVSYQTNHLYNLWSAMGMIWQAIKNTKDWKWMLMSCERTIFEE